MDKKELVSRANFTATQFVDESITQSCSVGTVVIINRAGKLCMAYHCAAVKEDSAMCSQAMKSFMQAGIEAYNKTREESEA